MLSKRSILVNIVKIKVHDGLHTNIKLPLGKREACRNSAKPLKSVKKSAMVLVLVESL